MTEPEFGSVVLDNEGFAYQHRVAGWKGVDGSLVWPWDALVESGSPLTLLAPISTL